MGEVIMTVPVTEQQKFSIWKKREQLRKSYFEKYGGFAATKKVINAALTVNAPTFMKVKKGWDQLMKLPVGDHIKLTYQLLPDKWKPWSDDDIQSETFGPFGLYYHMMTKIKQNARDVESDIASMFRNSQGEWFPEDLDTKDYLTMFPRYLNAKMHQKINPELSFPQAAQMPYLSITEDAEQL